MQFGIRTETLPEVTPPRESRPGLSPVWIASLLPIRWKRSFEPQLIGAEQLAGADALQEGRLRGFQRNQAAKDMEEVDQVGRVFREPMVGLNAVKR